MMCIIFELADLGTVEQHNLFLALGLQAIDGAEDPPL
jgi:hypothetical protein